MVTIKVNMEYIEMNPTNKVKIIGKGEDKQKVIEKQKIHVFKGVLNDLTFTLRVKGPLKESEEFIDQMNIYLENELIVNLEGL